MKADNVREIALETLLYITREKQYSHIVLNDVLSRYQYLEKADRSFLTRVVNGTLEHMIEMDYIINQFSKVKVNKLKPVIRTILRMSIFQMRYMDRIPDRAVVSEAVKLAQKKGFVNLKGFVNGVLRNVSRQKENLSFPPKEQALEYLSITYSLPEWLVKQWLRVYDFETIEQMGKAFFQEKPLTIRCNVSRITPGHFKEELEAEGVSLLEYEELPYAFALKNVDYLAKLESFQKGHFYVQDLSSMQVAEWASPKEGDVILDVCAAPGGKAIHLAEMLKGTGCVTARDLTDYKLALMEENIERSGLENIQAQKWDATVFDPDWEGEADIVIADLPCSGLGVLGKKVDLKYNMTPEIQEELVKLQRRILSVIAPYVKEGGKLLYSTCTIHKEENEENAAWFLKEFPQFQLMREEQILPSEKGNDGFYIAYFEHTGVMDEEGYCIF